MFNRNRIWDMYIWLFCNLMKFDYVIYYAKGVFGEKENGVEIHINDVDFSIEFSPIEN